MVAGNTQNFGADISKPPIFRESWNDQLNLLDIVESETETADEPSSELNLLSVVDFDDGEDEIELNDTESDTTTITSSDDDQFEPINTTDDDDVTEETPPRPSSPRENPDLDPWVESIQQVLNPTSAVPSDRSFVQWSNSSGSFIDVNGTQLRRLGGAGSPFYVSRNGQLFIEGPRQGNARGEMRPVNINIENRTRRGIGEAQVRSAHAGLNGNDIARIGAIIDHLDGRSGNNPQRSNRSRFVMQTGGADSRLEAIGGHSDVVPGSAEHLQRLTNEIQLRTLSRILGIRPEQLSELGSANSPLSNNQIVERLGGIREGVQIVPGGRANRPGAETPERVAPSATPFNEGPLNRPMRQFVDTFHAINGYGTNAQLPQAFDQRMLDAIDRAIEDNSSSGAERRWNEEEIRSARAFREGYANARNQPGSNIEVQVLASLSNQTRESINVELTALQAGRYGPLTPGAADAALNRWIPSGDNIYLQSPPSAASSDGAIRSRPLSPQEQQQMRRLAEELSRHGASGIRQAAQELTRLLGPENAGAGSSTIRQQAMVDARFLYEQLHVATNGVLPPTPEGHAERSRITVDQTSWAREIPSDRPRVGNTRMSSRVWSSLGYAGGALLLLNVISGATNNPAVSPPRPGFGY